MAVPSVLIVEDEPDILELLALHFTRQGYDVRRACCVVDALAQIKQQLPNLVLTDLCLPGPGGIEIVRFLRADARSAKVPVIMVSAAPAPPPTGPDAEPFLFVGKPFGLQDINIAVDMLMNRASRAKHERLGAK
ncbi:MAG TPA: response regulator [Hyphomicrobiales bacterium]|nr:response regulator [Hyphomicrobiales bacterium]